MALMIIGFDTKNFVLKENSIKITFMRFSFFKMFRLYQFSLCECMSKCVESIWCMYFVCVYIGVKFKSVYRGSVYTFFLLVFVFVINYFEYLGSSSIFFCFTYNRFLVFFFVFLYIIQCLHTYACRVLV